MSLHSAISSVVVQTRDERGGSVTRFGPRGGAEVEGHDESSIEIGGHDGTLARMEDESCTPDGEEEQGSCGDTVDRS